MAIADALDRYQVVLVVQRPQSRHKRAAAWLTWPSEARAAPNFWPIFWLCRYFAHGMSRRRFYIERTLRTRPKRGGSWHHHASARGVAMPHYGHRLITLTSAALVIFGQIGPSFAQSARPAAATQKAATPAPPQRPHPGRVSSMARASRSPSTSRRSTNGRVTCWRRAPRCRCRARRRPSRRSA